MLFKISSLKVEYDDSFPTGFTLLSLANTEFSHLHLKVEPKLTALNIVLYANTMPCFAFFFFTPSVISNIKLLPGTSIP